MKTNRVVLAVALATLLGVVPAAQAGLGENIPKKAWTLPADVRALLSEWKEEAKAYRPRSDHIGLFARGQLKYGCNRRDFLHNWYERPLLQDSALAVQDDPNVLINSNAWQLTAAAVRKGRMDGLAACPTQSGRFWIKPRSVEPGGEMTVFFELPYGYHERDLDGYMRVADLAWDMPNAYKIDGKIVLTRYPTATEGELGMAEALRQALAEKYGADKFAVIYYVKTFENKNGENILPDGPMTVAALQEARDHLRRVLRKTDGLFLGGWEVYWPRRYSPEFDREVVIPMVQAVMAEPEFAGKKYLGMPLCQGHANCYRWCYSLDSNANQMAVESLKSLEIMRPDFILACEWDEENENTHFRPTVSSGWTNMRLFRAFANRFAGRAPERWPDDTDVSRPNLVISYRKSLVVGEPVEAEVLNIPDGTFAGETFSVTLRWKDAEGRVLRDLGTQTLKADEMSAVRFICRASELAEARAIVPELQVSASKGARLTLSEGLWPLDIHAIRQVDTWWIKTPIREVPTGVTGGLACSDADATGVYTITGHAEGVAKFQSVEVLEGPDTVFMDDPEGNVPDGIERFVVDIQGFPAADGHFPMSGTISVEGAPNVVLASESKPAVTRSGNTWTLANAQIRGWPYALHFEMPAGEVADAEVVVDLPGRFSGRFPLSAIMTNDVMGTGGPGGGSMTVRRFLSQRQMPLHLDKTTSDFSFRMKPIDANSVVRLQTVDENGRVWRSKPYFFFRTPTGRKTTLTFFERDEEKVRKTSIDSSLVPREIRYDLSGARGTVLEAEGLGRAYWGIMGGYCPQVNGIGRGESDYGNAPADNITTNVTGWKDSTPTYVAEPDGSNSVHFAGAEYVTLPQQIISMYSGWTVDVDVWPEQTNETHAVFGCSSVGCNLSLKKGVPTAEYFSAVRYAWQWGAVQTARGPAVTPGQWNSIRLCFDQKHLWIETNGVAGDKIALSGYMHQQRYTTVGAENSAFCFFRGKMRNLVVRTGAVTTEEDVDYVLDVPAGTTNALGAADLEALDSGGYERIVKKGKGTLVATNGLSFFRGEVRIADGVYLVNRNGEGFFGHGDRAVHVEAGAAIHVCAPLPENQCKFRGLHFYMAGDGPDGRGVLVNTSPCDEYNLFLGSKVTLTGDAKFSSRYRIDFRNDVASAVLDANGYNFHYVCTDVNGVRTFYVTGSSAEACNFKDFVVDHALVGVDQGFFRSDGGSALVLTNGAAAYRSPQKPGRLDPLPTGLTMSDGTTFYAEKSGASNPLTGSQYGTNLNTFAGPAKFSGTVNIAGNGTGSPFTLGGPVSGTGTLNAPLVRLQLTSAENTYAGRIVVRAANEANGENTGLRLYRGANMPPASALELENAQLVLDENSVFRFPPISLKGKCKVVGGLAADPTVRAVAASVTKTGAAELYWDAALDVTGRTEIAAGVLRLAAPKVGNPGLFEGRTPTTARQEAGKPYFYDYVGPNGWKGLGCTTRRREGPAAAFARAEWNYYTCIGYHGYVWNRTAADVTWDVAACMGTYTYLYVDGVSKGLGSGQGGHRSIPLVLTPGPHEIYLYVVELKLREDQDKAYPGPTLGYYAEWWPFAKYCGLAYDADGTIGETCTNPSVLTMDYINSHFVPFRDPGDGSLFTVDDKTTDEIDQRGYHPGFSNLVVKAGAAVDLNGNDLAVGFVGGAGTVSNGTLTVKGGLAPAADDLAAGCALSVCGTVAFAKGSRLRVPAELPRPQIGADYLLLTADGGISGLPVVDDPGRVGWESCRWKLVRQGNELRLTALPSRGFMLQVD